MMCSLKKYKNIFGIPKTGVHKFRVNNVAFIDYLLTIMAAFIIAYITDIPVVITTVIIFLLGILLHALFGVNTSTLRYLNIDCK